MTVQAHDNKQILVPLIFGPAAVQERAFELSILDGTSTLDGANHKRYTSASLAQADNTAGFLSNQALAEVEAALQQPRAPEGVWVSKYDDAGGEDPSDAFALIAAEEVNVVAVTTTTREDSDLEALSAAVEANNDSATAPRAYICGVQSSNVDLKTSGLPAALANLGLRDWTLLYFHDDNAEPLSTAHLAARLAFPPADFTAGGAGQVNDVDALTSLTSAEYDFLKANRVNFPARFGSVARWVADGVTSNTAGPRGLEQLVSLVWIQDQIRVRAQQLFIDASARGEIIPVDIEGQITMEAQVVRPVLDDAAARNKILGIGDSDETFILRPTITTADQAAKRVPLEVSIKPREGARAFTSTINFQRA